MRCQGLQVELNEEKKYNIKMKKKNSRIITTLLPLIKIKNAILAPFTHQSIRKYLLRYGFIFLLAQSVILILAISQIYAVAMSNISKEVSKKVAYRQWISIAKEYPHSPDILYNAAVASVKLGQKKEALNYLEKALEIDPSFQDAINLKRKIEK